MRISTRGGGLGWTPALKEHAERRLGFALSRFGNRLGTVTVRILYLNGPRGGVDKTCRVQLRLAGNESLVVQSTDTDIYAAIDRASERAGRVVARELAIRVSHGRAPRAGRPSQGSSSQGVVLQGSAG